MATIAPSRRLRRTPFSDGVEAAGVKGYTVYNHMLLPTVFRSVIEDYHHLKAAVQVWDVACERQVEIRGPDASRLVQMLTPRDLRGMLAGQCAGLLSYGNDMTRENTPHEAGLGRFCSTQTAIGCIGRDALLRVSMEGPVRQIRALEIDGAPLGGTDRAVDLMAGDRRVGQITSLAHSPDFDTNIAIGMVRMTHWEAGTELQAMLPGGGRTARVRDGFWL